MKAVHAVLLFVALTGVATCLFERKYTFVEKYLSWTDAQAYCRKNYVDMLTITSQGDLKKLKNDEEASIQSWIGLRKRPQETAYTQWSDGTKLTFTAWKVGEPNELTTNHCVSIMDFEFVDYNCTNTLMFYCYKFYPTMIVVQTLMNWEEALEYCRMHYTDLVSVTTETDMCVTNRSLKDQTSLWTGLRFMDGLWFWVNQEILQNLSSLPSCPVKPFHCGALTTETVLKSRDCSEKMNFICYNKEE